MSEHDAGPFPLRSGPVGLAAEWDDEEDDEDDWDDEEDWDEDEDWEDDELDEEWEELEEELDLEEDERPGRPPEDW